MARSRQHHGAPQPQPPRPKQQSDLPPPRVPASGEPPARRDYQNNRVAVVIAAVAVIVSAIAAGFTGLQVWVARDIEERQLRPYLYAIPADTKATALADGSIQMWWRPKIKVFGQTMAGGVNPQWEIRVLDYPMKEENITFTIQRNSQTNAILAPGEPASIEPKTLTIAKEDIAAINAGTKRIYASGTVLYYDAFAGARWTNFCWSTSLKLMANSDGEFDTCPIHNGADWNAVSKASPIAFHVRME
jgi:hypothetical protein